MEEIVGIFPTPLLISQGALPEPLVAALIKQFEETQTGANVRTTKLSHTPTASPKAHENYLAVVQQIAPKIREYGHVLMGEELNWGVKDIWINRMETGGAQKMHNHANSFISGIVYLTPTGDKASTVFYRNNGATTFQFQNENNRCRITPFNTPVFQMPPMQAGDLVLFPSYMMHEVPPNRGTPRMTAAFNALPSHLDSWGYVVGFR